ncbi:hypothetical protein A8990_1146 [Paenibacillus taihuensis]|uniref:LiaI-LiaF-like transmembrane region domain-containing protein n=1 Tax=Paenibacillus taihuensis TaxID=1156355 RepID=A0A3D9S7E3_9BACL|nr:DUF5668 domain-containing protein [Paenibacillus taihuensis]REE84472.1 hypothetical protein A8990_1146 [Paenibacillus taihuensis]
MRQWRVGTWSMGAALIAMGIMLLASSLGGFQWFDQGIVWWPMLLILLGLEIVIYLWRSKSEQQSAVLRYDLFSIIVVAALGGCCLVFTTVSATGLLDEVRGSIGSREVRVEAQEISERIAANVKKIVVQGENYWNGRIHLDADGSDAGQLSAFGACRYDLQKDAAAPGSPELVVARQAGETLYVTVNRPSEERHMLNDGTPSCDVTIVLPSEQQVMVRPEIGMQLPAGSKLPAGWQVQR